MTQSPAEGGKYAATWESLNARPTPDWYRDAIFGIFIHWGVYSVPSFAPVGKYAEWYWRDLESGRKAGPDSTSTAVATWKFHEANYGPEHSYHDFAPQFRAELWNPDQWADQFARSGAKYVVLTSKHHDGFCLWPSSLPNQAYGRPWNSVEAGPKRDLLGELSAAVRKKGLRMGFYYSLYEWFNPMWLNDRKRYIDDYMRPQFMDAVTKYKPSVIFSDGEWELPSAEWKSAELLAWLFNESPVRDEVAVNDRWGKETRHKHGGYYTTEYGSGLENTDHAWEENRGMGHSYGFNRMETLTDYRTSKELLLMLADTVSRGGNLLLNVGPTADGRIPGIMEQRLNDMGDWLKTNGDAVYGTRPWSISRQWSAGRKPSENFGDYKTGYDINKLVRKQSDDAAIIEAFFTKRDGNVFVIVPEWPGKEFAIRNVRLDVSAKVTLLAGSKPIQWSQRGDDAWFDCSKACEEPGFRFAAPYAFRITGKIERLK
jgi:alpha-L-fucosidase